MLKLPKEFLQHTPVLDMEFAEWKQGVPTPINKGNLTPSQEALGLLSRFATGQFRMTGEVVEHLPVTNQDKSIGELLKGLDLTSPKKKKVDGSVNRNKKLAIAQKESKTKAKLLAEKNPRTKIPGSEICPENIIVGSPMYTPYIRIPSSKKGKGQFGKKKLVFPMSLATNLGMRHKQTPTQRQLHNKAKRLSSMGGGVPCKTAPRGKTFRAPISAKTPHKGGSGVPVPKTGGIKKPERHKPGIVALREI